MNVYIITESHCSMFGAETLRIIAIPPDQEASFLKEYAGRIIVAGFSVREVIEKYHLRTNDHDQ